MRRRPFPPALTLVSVLLCAACSGPESASSPSPGPSGADGERSSSDARSPRVPRREQEAGLERCATVIERMDSPEAAPTFSRLMRECSGLYARRACRDALAADEFSRDRVAEACRTDYCEDLRPAPSFCTIDMPTDEEFLAHYARFSRMVLRRDLRRVMDDDGANEIADLFADLVEAQVGRQ